MHCHKRHAYAINGVILSHVRLVVKRPISSVPWQPLAIGTLLTQRPHRPAEIVGVHREVGDRLMDIPVLGEAVGLAGFPAVTHHRVPTLRTRPMRICAYCLMPNHWHMVLWPENDGELSAFMQRLSVTHVARDNKGDCAKKLGEGG